MKNLFLALILGMTCLSGPVIATPVCDPEIDYIILEGRVGGCDVLTIGLCCGDSLMECYGESCHGSWELSCY